MAGETSPLTQRPAGGDLHPIFAVVFALNYMMGSGYLTLPKAYADASLAIGVGMTCVMALGACVSAECILDAMDRAAWIVAARGHPARGGSFYRLALRDDARSPVLPTRPQVEAPRPAQLPDLCSLFLGDAGNRAYVFMLSSFMVGSMWCYAAIFGQSLVTHLGEPFGPGSYAAYVAVFAAMVVPLSLQDLSDQKNTQALLAVGRQVMLVAMVVTSIGCLVSQGPVEPMPARPEPWTGVAALAPVVAFSVTLHHSVPQIVAPVDAADRPFALNCVFRGAFAAAAVIYVLFAVPVAKLFGRATESASNLDWATYHHVSDPLDPNDAFKVALASGLAQFVVLYPALNVVATYPLNAITFGDALMATFREHCTTVPDGRTNDAPPSRAQTKAFRLLAGVPPLVGAALVSDISAITGVTGCFGLAMCAVLPGLLAIRAQRVAPGPTPHASCLNGPKAAIMLALCGTLLTASALGAALHIPGLE